MSDELTLNADEAGRGALRDSPRVIVFPPALPLGTLLLGFLLWLICPWPILLASVSAFRIAGVVLIAIGVSLMIWGRTTMVRAGTNVPPNKPTLVIVTAGPFRFTRNPLYLGGVMAYLGFTLIFNSAWLLLLFVPMVRLLRWGIIEREERYLEGKFGQVYLAYKAEVPRWI